MLITNTTANKNAISKAGKTAFSPLQQALILDKKNMPTILRIFGFRFFFFSNEGNEPPHIHVEKANAYAKYWLEPVEYADSYAFRAKELTQIRKLVEENRQLFLDKWHEFFSK